LDWYFINKAASFSSTVIFALQRGWNALMWASHKNHLDLVKLLVAADAELRAHSKVREDALWWAWICRLQHH
jgi:ankyrin repeat protein